MNISRRCSILTPVAILMLLSQSASAQQFAPLMESSIYSWTNVVRQQQGRGHVALNAKLTQAAQGHAAHMAARGVMAHTLEGSTLVDRVNRTGYPYASISENVAYNFGYQNPAWQLFDGWMKSEGHYRNIMNEEFNEIGVGVVISPSGRYYACQVFGKRAPLMQPPSAMPYPPPYPQPQPNSQPQKQLYSPFRHVPQTKTVARQSPFYFLD